MPKVPLNIINKQIDIFGEEVTITAKSDKTYSDWGDVSETETDTESIKAVYNVYGKQSVFQNEGVFQEGDITFFFKSDQDGLEHGSKITRANGDTYEIDDPRDHGTQGSTYVVEVLVKKI